ALAALATEHQPAQHRNIVIRGDGRFARRTSRARAHYGNFPRHAIDADVQKAAEKQPKQKKCCGKKPGVSGKVEYVQGLLRIWKLMGRLYARRMTYDLRLGINEGNGWTNQQSQFTTQKLPDYQI